MLDKIINGLKSIASPGTTDVQLSIGITTFEARFEKYFVPLLNTLREFDQEAEIIVAVNGEHKKNFGESFRKVVLNLTASHKNVFPVVFPQFRGLAKLWNTIIIHSSCENILILNDDIMIELRITPITYFLYYKLSIPCRSLYNTDNKDTLQ